MSRHVLPRNTLGLAFAAAASLAELAPICALLRQNAPLSAILAAGLAYQVGGAAARWFPGRPMACAAGAVAGGWLLIGQAPAGAGWLVGLVALSWVLQAARRRYVRARPEDSPSPARKRGARVAGFAAAAVLPFWASLAAILAGVLTASALRLKAAPEVRPRLTGHPIEPVMILHQTHYFTYCYGLLLILSHLAGGPMFVGVWFGIGWITYLSAERLWSRTPLAYALVLGHLFVALTLGGLATLGHEPWGAVLTWTLTGFGGGTVYCLTRLHRGAGGHFEGLDLAEDLGHVGGTVIALLAVSLGGLDAWALAGLGALFALATVATYLTARPALVALLEEGP